VALPGVSKPFLIIGSVMLHKRQRIIYCESFWALLYNIYFIAPRILHAGSFCFVLGNDRNDTSDHFSAVALRLEISKG
jgi:hypothetical protein